MAVARVQSVGIPKPTATTSVAVGPGQGWATPTAGNALVGWFNGDSTVATPAGWTLGPSVIDGNGAYMFYKVSDGTESTVTFTGIGATAPCNLGLIEYSGTAASPFDVQGTSMISGTTGTATTAVSVTTTSTVGGVVIAFAALHVLASGTAHSTTPTWTNSFINFQTVNTAAASEGTNSVCDSFLSQLLPTAAGTYSTACSWTNAQQDRQELVLALKASAGTAATPRATRPTRVLQAMNRAGSF